MKIGIVTFNRANNYGAVLQAYALQNHINSLGFDSEILDYRDTYIENSYKVGVNFNGGIKKFLFSIINLPVLNYRYKQFEKFRGKYLNVGPEYDDKNINQANKRYDLYIFGSDQIWNPELTSENLFYLGSFVDDRKRLYAYSASFGKTEIEENIKEDYVALLKKYQAVSVREMNSQILYRDLIHKHAEVTMDPVFLVSGSQWENFCKNNPQKRKYILMYHLQGNKTNVYQTALELSKKTGLKILEFQALLRPRNRRVQQILFDNPSDFLTYIKNAEYIVTDSFHATAFSIIFQKKIWVNISRGTDVSRTRAGYLLQLLHIENRIVPDDLEHWAYADIVSYNEVKKLLDLQIVRSKRYLANILK